MSRTRNASNPLRPDRFSFRTTPKFSKRRFRDFTERFNWILRPSNRAPPEFAVELGDQALEGIDLEVDALTWAHLLEAESAPDSDDDLGDISLYAIKCV